MNAALLVLSSAVGGDVTPAGWAEKPPVVVPAGGCSNCGPATHAAPTFAHAPSAGCCDPCGSSGGRKKLLDRLKGMFGGRKKKDDCGCAPATNGCGTANFGNGCATPLPHGAHAVPAAPVTPPKEMPKDDKTPKELPKGTGGAPDKGTAAAPAVVPIAPAAPAAPIAPAVRPNPVALPAIPAAPMSAPRAPGVSPY
jgi:hypothetical protein